MSLEDELNRYFHYPSFRKGQKEIVEELLKREEVLGILPTGAGKTICYALPTFMNHWHTLIISPLISLMEDQVSRLNKIHKNCAVALNSSQTSEEQKYVLQHLSIFQFVMISPELLQNQKIQFFLKKVGFQLGVVDEAHCISNWGFDFRPEYLQIPKIFNQLRVKNMLALTATAPVNVRNDIHEFLFLKRAIKEIRFPVNRENIGYVVEKLEKPEEKMNRLKEILSFLKGSGIIYCNTRKKCEELSYILKKEGILCDFYHGGLSPMVRKSLQGQFKKDQLQIIIATNAFGMGIDKGNIRFVIHYEYPGSLEDYVQETGRLSRDGKLGVALLFFSETDRKLHQHFAQIRNQEAKEIYFEHNENIVDKETFQHKIFEKNQGYNVMERFIESKNCYRKNIANYFQDEPPEIPEYCCSNHGLKIENYKTVFDEGKPQTFKQEQEENWQNRLHTLFFKER